MRALGFDVRREEARQMLQSVGKENATHVTLEDFEMMMAPKMGDRNSKEEIYKTFRLFDPENTGFITFRTLKSICLELGEGLYVTFSFVYQSISLPYFYNRHYHYRLSTKSFFLTVVLAYFLPFTFTGTTKISWK